MKSGSCHVQVYIQIIIGQLILFPLEIKNADFAYRDFLASSHSTNVHGVNNCNAQQRVDQSTYLWISLFSFAGKLGS